MNHPSEDDDPVELPMESVGNLVRTGLAYLTGGLVGLVTVFALASATGRVGILTIGLSFLAGAAVFVGIRPRKKPEDDVRLYSRPEDEFYED